MDKLFWEGSGAVFSNNIFYTASSIAMLSDKKPDNRTRFYNNCFYPSAAFAMLNWGSAVYSDNFYGDPLFINPVAGSGFKTAEGYGIKPGSPCQKGGKLIGSNGGADFSGNILPADKPDVGAFQSAIILKAGSTLAKKGGQ
ncbi:hypothetical protein [Niabella hibiscisoli]|uniref:hypothetical protein n=1 Tax=Niabella hibiscisoli TaxID=1825928 RepID=UPI001F0E6089|nr:hypothetical protein [Niabella hibiscisoli]MCH5716150.1 hypothetical protein [Niabella hibiscisoli]